MGAKAARKQPKTPAPIPVVAPAPAVAGEMQAEIAPAWLDSADPQKRMWGKIIVAGVWLYVAALWLLALDQTFRWGIFGPQLPPAP
jgi:hypothetical protein